MWSERINSLEDGMEAELVALAASAVTALTPYLEPLADKSAEAFGKKAPAAAEGLFNYLRDKFKSHPSASEALEDLSKDRMIPTGKPAVPGSR